MAMFAQWLKQQHLFRNVSSTLGCLADTTGSERSWSENLPARLQSMHSHWLSRKHGVVLLRGHKYNDRRVEFILRLPSPLKQQANAAIACADMQIYHVPDHMTRKAVRCCHPSQSVPYHYLRSKPPASFRNVMGRHSTLYTSACPRHTNGLAAEPALRCGITLQLPGLH